MMTKQSAEPDVEALRIAGLLKAAIEEARVSIRETERRAGMGQGTLNSKLTGRASITIQDLAAVCAAIDLPVVELYLRMAGAPPTKPGNSRRTPPEEVMRSLRKMLDRWERDAHDG